MQGKVQKLIKFISILYSGCELGFFPLDKLKRLEIPERVYLCKEKWSVENGLLTDAMEVKRKPINEKYEKELQKFKEK